MQKIGFIGQGWIGKNYSDDLEERGYDVTRYSLEPPYDQNKDAIADCDIVFVAVPTPTTANGFDVSIVERVLSLIGKGKTVVIKSTILPGTTEMLSAKFPDLYITHSPEFLVEASAAYDARHPQRNIIGIPVDGSTPPEIVEQYRTRAQAVLSVLPDAPYSAIMPARSAELVKYAGNCLLYLKVVFMNMLYDTAIALGQDWGPIKDAIRHDRRLGNTHLDPIHKSGRGAGGHCFIKDFAAFEEIYSKLIGDFSGSNMLTAIQDKNVALLTNSGKDLDLLKECGLI